MKIIDKTVLDVHEPENTGVMWAEPVEDGVNLHIFNNDEWNNLSGISYKKPASGIPRSDLASGVQASLDSADSAYQKPSTGIPLNDLSQDVKDAIENAGSLKEESDPIFTASPAHGITSSDISNWNSKQDALTFDSAPTAGSNNPVTSAGIKAYVDNATPTLTMDDTPTSGSNNPVKSSGIYNALQGKQSTLTFDSTPTASSSNPVTSGGVKTALDLKANQSTTYTKTEVDALFEDVAYLGDDDGQATTLDFDPQADTVWNKAQTLGSAQQAQARNNIGAVGSVTVNGTTYTPTNGNVDLGTISGGGGSTGHRVMIVTQAYYNSLSNYDADTVYIISDSIETAPEVTIMTSAEYADATKSNTTIYFVK